MFYRTAEIADIEVLVDLRKKQLMEEGLTPDSDIDGELTAFFQRKLQDRSLVEWVGLEGGAIVATAAVVFYDFPPSFANRTGVKGYVTNMYTAPEHRGKGVATALLDKLAAEAKARNVASL